MAHLGYQNCAAGHVHGGDVEAGAKADHQCLTGAAQRGPLVQRLDRIRQQQLARKRGSREEVDKIARRSLVAHDAVASETLAQLLVRQGQYQHASKMYRRLILLYPEKKTIFAGLIKDLKEKL